jgi:hypothetical protein
MDWGKFKGYCQFASRSSGKSKLNLFIDAVFSVYKYNIGLIDYYIFEFYEKDANEKKKWMGTGFKYEYDRIMNPKGSRELLFNKMRFLNHYRAFINHAFCDIDSVQQQDADFEKVWNNRSGKLVVKDAMGQCGWDVEVLKIADFTPESLLEYMKSKGFNLLEEFIIQHNDLAALSDTALNTVRIITQINPNGGVDIIGPTLRISVNSSVDNMAVGNLAAPIDAKTGIVMGPGQYQDNSKKGTAVHPLTGVQIQGFKIPFWEEVINLCTEAAMFDTSNKSIGWDVAITDSGPSFIEGNHNWCKILWQIPRQKGLKEELLPYLKEAKKGNPVYKKAAA